MHRMQRNDKRLKAIHHYKMDGHDGHWIAHKRGGIFYCVSCQYDKGQRKSKAAA